MEGRKLSVGCAGDKPGPEHTRMGSDKICSVFVFQQSPQKPLEKN